MQTKNCRKNALCLKTFLLTKYGSILKPKSNVLLKVRQIERKDIELFEDLFLKNLVFGKNSHFIKLSLDTLWTRFPCVCELPKYIKMKFFNQKEMAELFM